MKGSLGLLSLQPSTCFCKSLLILSLLTVATSRSHNTPFSPHHIASCMPSTSHSKSRADATNPATSREATRDEKKIQFPENAIPVPWHRLQLPFQTKAINWSHRKLKIFIHSKLLHDSTKVCNFSFWKTPLNWPTIILSITGHFKKQVARYKYTSFANLCKHCIALKNSW